MSRYCQRTYKLAVVLALGMLVLIPMGYGTVEHAATVRTATGPTLPPPPWC
jgi:hypothetical protein